MLPFIRALRARPTSVLLVGLMVLFVGLSPVRGDIGRGGGIVILPSAKHITEWGKNTRTIGVFASGVDIAFQLAPGISNVTVIIDDGQGNVSTGSLSGPVFTLRSSELGQLAAAGAARFDVYLIDPGQVGYHLDFRFIEGGDVELKLR